MPNPAHRKIRAAMRGGNPLLMRPVFVKILPCPSNRANFSCFGACRVVSGSVSTHRSDLQSPELEIRVASTTVGTWPSGRATLFGSADRRFESYRPSQHFLMNCTVKRLHRHFLICLRFTDARAGQGLRCMRHSDPRWPQFLVWVVSSDANWARRSCLAEKGRAFRRTARWATIVICMIQTVFSGSRPAKNACKLARAICPILLRTS